MNKPVTQWFSGKPLVIGVWEVEGTKHQRTYGLRCFQFWNGESWKYRGLAS